MMPLHPGWEDLALRIACTVAAGGLIGINRDEHGRPAGLRTMLLVGLAACLAMILANLLLPLTGKANDGFSSMDVMRLPLGILSGMGFLGGGAIVRRTGLVQGVTTAATMWIVTVIGLCFGADALVLGAAATVLTWLALNWLKWAEGYIRRDRRGTLTVTVSASGPAREELTAIAESAGYSVRCRAVTLWGGGDSELRLELRWRALVGDASPPGFLGTLARRDGVQKLVWQPA
jgi:putative Mg2+ transporter-C (MgtC) family protein